MAYEAFEAAIKRTYGDEFAVYDDLPDATELRKELPAANISFISGGCEKAFMREFIPHALRKNYDGTFTVATETARFEYLIQISFFADKKGRAQALSTKFYAETELENEIPIPEDPWSETMSVFLDKAPLPPRGEPDLYQCDQIWRCRGKLLTTEIVNAVDIMNFRIRIGGL